WCGPGAWRSISSAGGECRDDLLVPVGYRHNGAVSVHDITIGIADLNRSAVRPGVVLLVVGRKTRLGRLQDLLDGEVGERPPVTADQPRQVLPVPHVAGLDVPISETRGAAKQFRGSPCPGRTIAPKSANQLPRRVVHPAGRPDRPRANSAVANTSDLNGVRLGLSSLHRRIRRQRWSRSNRWPGGTEHRQCTERQDHCERTNPKTLQPTCFSPIGSLDPWSGINDDCEPAVLRTSEMVSPVRARSLRPRARPRQQRPRFPPTADSHRFDPVARGRELDMRTPPPGARPPAGAERTPGGGAEQPPR